MCDVPPFVHATQAEQQRSKQAALNRTACLQALQDNLLVSHACKHGGEAKTVSHMQSQRNVAQHDCERARAV